MSKPVRGYLFDDYAEIPFTSEPAKYYVGTNALNSDPDLLKKYPMLAKNPDNNQPGFTAHSTLLYATEDCWVWFNGEDRVRHFIPAGVWFTFNRMIHTLYVVRDAVDGTLYVHFEG